LAWCVLVLCRGPHSSPLFENILERQYRIALAYGLRDRFLPVLNGFLQALGEGCLVLDSDLCQRLRAAHVVLKLTPEGLCGQRGQLLPVLRLEQAFDFGAGLGNAVAARAGGVLSSHCWPFSCIRRWRRSCSSRFALKRLRGMVSLLMVKLLAWVEMPTRAVKRSGHLADGFAKAC
jgi:hypothetical protein